jgi:xanthine/CO dehydrogenase XdhC/CoxF family maturation factor
VSGGCLESEVARRAWWLTAQGPVVERYSTVEDDGDRPYGSGCGGVVFLLLERGPTAGPLLGPLEAAFEARTSLAVATILDGAHMGQRAFAGVTSQSENNPTLLHLAEQSLERRTSIQRKILMDGAEVTAWADYRPARPGLWIFGAGDDAQPLQRLARELGWFVAVADGRSHLATQQRFPSADLVRVMPVAGLPGTSLSGDNASGPESPLFGLKSTDAAAVMSHSFEQDSRILSALMALDSPPAYIGVLGPQRRTLDLLREAARHLDPSGPENRAEQWIRQIHSPMGLDMGAETPATIAVSILAEIQLAFSAGTGLPLRQVRAAKLATVQA